MNTTLEDIVLDILEDGGFSPDNYILDAKQYEVYVDFDDRGAVDYVIGISMEEKWRDQISANYKKNGKRHRVCFYLW